ncbi:MAG: tetratricopeptide repeat protein [Dissulfurispiraceae bacterium]
MGKELKNLKAGKTTAFKHLRLTELVGLSFLCVAVFLTYSNSLHGIWALDDVLVNQPLGIGELFQKAAGRKITYFSFILNQAINPNDPVNFRVFNILIHIANSLLVYCVALITLKLYYKQREVTPYYFFIALISALLFALHPLNINAVAYIIQRMASLATLFTLLSLILYIYAHRTLRTSLKIAMYVGSLACIVLGILSKENAVVGIPLILLYDYIFLAPFNNKAFMKRAVVVAGLGICALFLANFYVPLYKTILTAGAEMLKLNEPLSYHFWMAIDVYWTPLEHILTELRVICRYLFLFIFPLSSYLVFDHWGYPISRGLFEPITTFFSLVLILAAITFSVIKIRKYPFLSFGILWYFIAISLESFFAVGADLYFEHRNYLPLTGLSFGLVAQVGSIFRDRILTKYMPWVIVVLLSLTLGCLTFQRNTIWKDPITFWKDNAQKTPTNVRAQLALANSYLLLSDFQNAMTYYKISVRLASEGKRPYYTVEALYRLGLMDMMLEQSAEGEKVIEALEKVAPDSSKLKILRGYYSYLSRDYDDAIKTYLLLLSSPKQYEKLDGVTLFTLLGDAYRATGKADEALNSYERALSKNISFPAAYHGIAKVYMLKGDLKTASEYLIKVITLQPDNFAALSDMANILLIRGGGADKAFLFAARAVSLNPPFYKPYLIMGVVLIALNRDEDAQLYFTKAQEFQAPGYLLSFNRAWGYALKGDREKQKYYLRELLSQKDVPMHIRETANKLLSKLEMPHQ